MWLLLSILDRCECPLSGDKRRFMGEGSDFRLGPQTVFQRGACRQHRKAGIDPNRPFKAAIANVRYPIAKRPSNGRDQLGS